MATKKKLDEKAGKVLDGLFSGGSGSTPEGSGKDKGRKTGGKSQKSPEKPQKAQEKAQKKVFSFRAEVDQVDSWRVWADAKGLKVEELGSLAINDYIKKHPLTADQKKIYELKLAQKKS